MKNVFINILYICVGVSTFVVAGSIVNYFISKPETTIASKAIDEAMGDIIHRSKDHNNKYETENLSEGAKDFLKSKAEKLKGLEKKSFIFGSFIGFKYRQTVSTYNYCDSLGVKIDNFVKLFNEINNDVSIVVNNEMPENFESMVIIPATTRLFSKLVKDEFQEVSAKTGINAKEFCLIIDKTEKGATDHMNFSKILPDSYEFIMSYNKQTKVVK